MHALLASYFPGLLLFTQYYRLFFFYPPFCSKWLELSFASYMYVCD